MKGESHGGLEVKRGKSSNKTAQLTERALEAEFVYEITSPEDCLIHDWVYKLSSDCDATLPESWRERLCTIQHGTYLGMMS